GAQLEFALLAGGQRRQGEGVVLAFDDQVPAQHREFAGGGHDVDRRRPADGHEFALGLLGWMLELAAAAGLDAPERARARISTPDAQVTMSSASDEARPGRPPAQRCRYGVPDAVC